MCDYGHGDFVICVAEDDEGSWPDGPYIAIGDIVCVRDLVPRATNLDGSIDLRPHVSFEDYDPEHVWPTELFRLQQPRDPDLLAKLLSERAPPDLVGA